MRNQQWIVTYQSINGRAHSCLVNASGITNAEHAARAHVTVCFGEDSQFSWQRPLITISMAALRKCVVE